MVSVQDRQGRNLLASLASRLVDVLKGAHVENVFSTPWMPERGVRRHGWPNITGLDLSSNTMGDKTVATGEIAEALPSCTSLQTLILSDNSLGPDGMRALAVCLFGSVSLCLRL